MLEASAEVTAREIVFELAGPLADEDGFVRMDELLEWMVAREGPLGWPLHLTSYEGMQWLMFKSEYTRRFDQVGRLTNRGLELHPALLDETMMSRLKRRLHARERRYVEKMFLPDLMRIHWKAKDLSNAGKFSSHAIEELRNWARKHFAGWPRAL